MYIMTLRMTEV